MKPGCKVKTIPELDFDPRFRNRVGTFLGITDEPFWADKLLVVEYDNGPKPADWTPLPFLKDWPETSVYYFRLDEIQEANE